MKRSSIALLGALAVGLSAPAAAQSLSSAYVGGNIGQSKYRNACGITPNCDDTDTSWGLFAGYRFNRYLSAELGYQDLGRIGSPAGNVDGKAIELVGLGSFPISGPLSVYGKLGGYRGRLEGLGKKETNSDATYGLGLQFDFNRYFGVRGEWQRYRKLGGGAFGAQTDADVLRVGALWHFQ